MTTTRKKHVFWSQGNDKNTNKHVFWSHENIKNTRKHAFWSQGNAKRCQVEASGSSSWADVQFFIDLRIVSWSFGEPKWSSFRDFSSFMKASYIDHVLKTIFEAFGSLVGEQKRVFRCRGASVFNFLSPWVFPSLCHRFWRPKWSQNRVQMESKSVCKSFKKHVQKKIQKSFKNKPVLAWEREARGF